VIDTRKTSANLTGIDNSPSKPADAIIHLHFGILWSFASALSLQQRRPPQSILLGPSSERYRPAKRRPYSQQGDHMFHFLTAATLLSLALPLAVLGDDAKRDELNPADLPLKAKLIAKNDTYKFDLEGKSGQEFRKVLAEAEKAGKAPPAPLVDLVLELTNASDQEVKFWIDGDPVEVQLDLKGPESGAVTIAPKMAFTTDFRIPKVINLAPGKTYEIPIKSLQHGFRGISKSSYWTEPGDYTLTARYVTAISPAPKGAKEAEKGFGSVILVTAPIKIHVQSAK
jgi:hypothetical protein